MTDFNQSYKMAVDLIQYLVTLHGYVAPNTTVCVLVTKSGRVFNGVSHNEVHAEIEAVRNMQGFNENTVDSIIVVDANTRLAMLPCANCIRHILTLNPINNDAMVCMPDRPVPFRELITPAAPQAPVYGSALPAGQVSGPVSGQIAGPVSGPFAGPVSGQLPTPVPPQVSATRSSVVAAGRSKGALLNGKVNNLLAAAKTEVQSDEDIELLNEIMESTQKKKGLLGGLFGKK